VIGVHGVDGADWIWMTVWMGVWLIVIGVVVYAAARLAIRDRYGSAR